MRKAITIIICSMVALGLFLGVVLYRLGGQTIGTFAFDAWKLFSAEAHGGQYADINGIRLYYETFGSGPPVLVLHGGTGSLEDMRCQIAALAAERFVVAPDSRGQGRSSDADVPLSYGLMADDMLKLLDRLAIGRVDIVGWSDGGIIGLDLAIHHPERVRRLVAIGANYDVDGLAHPPALTSRPPRPPWVYSHYAPDPGHWPVLYQKVITMWRTLPHYSMSELGGIKAPTLIVAGEFDEIKREHTDRLVKAIPEAQEFIVTGATHFAVTQNHGVVDARILRFLDARTSEITRSSAESSHAK
jgi:pimeloyl-ACP methyl ester carboxylesterase